MIFIETTQTDAARRLVDASTAAPSAALTGQRLQKQAQEQARVADGQFEALKVRRAAMREQVQRSKEMIREGLGETAEPPLMPQEKEALRLLIEGVIRYHRKKMAETAAAV